MTIFEYLVGSRHNLIFELGFRIQFLFSYTCETKMISAHLDSPRPLILILRTLSGKSRLISFFLFAFFMVSFALSPQSCNQWRETGFFTSQKKEAEMRSMTFWKNCEKKGKSNEHTIPSRTTATKGCNMTRGIRKLGKEKKVGRRSVDVGNFGAFHFPFSSLVGRCLFGGAATEEGRRETKGRRLPAQFHPFPPVFCFP